MAQQCELVTTHESPARAGRYGSWPSHLDEGVIATEEEADLASVLGAGFPPHTGGAIRFVRGLGAGTFTARLRDLATRHGERFTPDPDLLDRRDLLAERAA